MTGEKKESLNDNINPNAHMLHGEFVAHGKDLGGEKEVTEEAINDKLNEIMESVDEKIDEKLPQIIRLLAKLLFNVRFDLNEMKLELLKVFKDECEEVNHKKEEEDGRFYT